MVRVLRTRLIYCKSARLPINSGSGDMSLVVFSLVNAKDHWRNPSRPVTVLWGGGGGVGGVEGGVRPPKPPRGCHAMLT